MEVLQEKIGSVSTDNIGKYNSLKKELNFWNKRLHCITSQNFNCEYFVLGNDNSSLSVENRDYIILSESRSNKDKKLQDDIILFLSNKIIERINTTVEQINELVK